MRRAFSLIEVLVVVSIVSTLVGLLIPAVNSSREAARSLCCRNNLRQIGVAVQLHEQSMGHLPGGGWGTSWVGDADLGSGSRQPGSWIFSLLPYMEQKAIYDMAGDGNPLSITDEQKASAARASSIPMDMFVCSSRRSSPTSPMATEVVWNMDYVESVSKTDYAVNAGDKTVRWGAGPSPADALAGRGFQDMGSSTGVAHQASQLKFEHVKDGLSNTYLVGEKRMHLSDASHDDQGALFGADLDTVRWTQEPPGSDSTEPGMNFGSAHHGSFGMLMCDGSVESTPYDIDPEVHSRLGNRKDGVIIAR